MPHNSEQSTRPRQYFAQIKELKTVEQRREALAKVPPEFREWVKQYLTMYWDRKRNG